MDIVSDLHYEFGTPSVVWPCDAAQHDVLLAGDVGCVMDGSFLRGVWSAASRYRHVYVVLGNHEYYNAWRIPMEEVERKARGYAKAFGNVTLLQREAVTTADGVRILGCTLWSDTRHCAKTVEAAMNDYRRIWTDKGLITAEDTSRMWERDVAWLRTQLEAECSGAPVLVLTHHGPHPACNPPAYADSKLIDAFVSRAPIPWSKVSVSVSGHTHGRLHVFTEEGVPLLSNCVGYPREIPGPCRPLRYDVLASVRGAGAESAIGASAESAIGASAESAIGASAESAIGASAESAMGASAESATSASTASEEVEFM
jgi:hypothetical protein